jgi:hypothetical protein
MELRLHNMNVAQLEKHYEALRNEFWNLFGPLVKDELVAAAKRDLQLNAKGEVHQYAREKLPCFVAGTLVHTKEGLKPIEEICVGDWVLSYPDDQAPPVRWREEGGERWVIFRQEDEYTYRQVTRTFVHEDKPICEVEIIDFSNGIETLKVTPDHPFYVKHIGWTPARELDFTCPLFAESFGNMAVGKVSVTGERARVYNLEVDEFHTYYVGRLGVWVHNICKFTKLTP